MSDRGPLFQSSALMISSLSVQRTCGVSYALPGKAAIGHFASAHRFLSYE